MTTTLTARTPEDLLAVVPVILGFHPAESVVMLTFGAPTPFHARVDLPPPELVGSTDTAPDLVQQLVEPSVRHAVARVVLMLYSTDQAAVASIARALHRGFRSADIEVVEMLVADGKRWHPLSRFGVAEGPGTPYDVSAHPFVVESVVGGAVTHRSRAELAATVEPDAAAGRRVSAELGHPVSAGEAVALVEEHARASSVPDDAELAGLVVAVVDPAVRDAVYVLAQRETAPSYVRLWTDVVRRTPPGLAASPLALLAGAAWLAGQGALAWCALDRLFEIEPEHTLGRLLAELLARAVPPTFVETLHAGLRGGAMTEL